ncbi:MAG: hypothetical protein F6K14_34095 [Symploca sp. SIO2C1]|nr:hypothetical protein [Symploca sp. SIO2C1]
MSEETFVKSSFLLPPTSSLASEHPASEPPASCFLRATVNFTSPTKD